ncbi:YlmH family RNA-binding protein [Pontibacillus litoralis]|uniref:RNA-binding protein S4 n=1 Tax=Pontibacillus litoralis JSM 072002 TaxID=1385512 RepID=A0A0A5GBG3_9BACI|nr:RNA-binding protein [Pontibacillus litoralis]KGX88523.1 RNA-binding protein S4 [Pontibacillus litoralis JSM 072002]
MEIYQHFRKEEHAFIDQVIHWREAVEQRYVPKLTDFLHPRELFIIQSIIGQANDIQWQAFGGLQNAERKRVVIAPYYETIEEQDYELVLLEASYPNKFVTIEHRDVLGSCMSLGVKREKTGDMYVHEDRIQIVVAKGIAPYVMMNLTNIKKATIQFEEKSLDCIVSKQEDWLDTNGTVSSLRLDTVLNEIYHLSRQKASQYIQKGYVKVNFRIVEDPAFLLQKDDMISLRGKGRSQIKDIEGKTKKDKWRITTAILK